MCICVSLQVCTRECRCPQKPETLGLLQLDLIETYELLGTSQCFGNGFGYLTTEISLQKFLSILHSSTLTDCVAKLMLIVVDGIGIALCFNSSNLR